jgi:periplasmic divalent cation tolerance protein
MLVLERLVVTCTFPDEAGARSAAELLVRRRLAACVQVLGPVHSTYRWRGRVETADEWLCLAKTTAAVYPRLESALARTHPYDTPEIVAVPVTAGSQRYLDWLTRNVGPARRRKPPCR